MMSPYRRFACLGLASTLAAGFVLSAPSPALSADAGGLYAPAGSPLAVRSNDSVTLTRPDGSAMPVRVVYPAVDPPGSQSGSQSESPPESPSNRSPSSPPISSGPWPVIIYSHGMFTSNRAYMPVFEHWASQGYVVIAPNHLDADGAFKARRNEDVERLAVSRANDLTQVMDSLPRITEAVRDLAGRLRPPPYAGAGHSMGTYTAMLEAGLKLRNPRTGVVTSTGETRIGMLVMSSDPGKMALMPDGLWKGVNLPTFMTTGTADYGISGKGRRATEYTSEVLSGAAVESDSRSGVPRYLLLLDDGDHYYGGLIHRDPGGLEPDVQGLELFTTFSTAFLDAYLKQDAAALEYLRTVDAKAVSKGRASFTRP